MPPLKFSFRNDDAHMLTYEIPTKSFFYSDVDWRTNITTCHLGIVGQKWHDGDRWILGQSFMENFYVTYDLSEAGQPRVGISMNADAGIVANKFAFVLALMIVAVISGIFVTLLVMCCVKEQQRKRLEKAKAYFDDLKQKEGTGEAEDYAGIRTKLAVDDEQEVLDSSDPNNFVSR